jgi:hypothetical protein
LPVDCSINIALPQVRFKEFEGNLLSFSKLTLLNSSDGDQIYEESVNAKQETGVKIKLKITKETKNLYNIFFILINLLLIKYMPKELRYELKL